MNDAEFSAYLRKMPTAQLRKEIWLLELMRDLLGDDPRMWELMHASRRLNQRPEKVLEWVLKFCSRDLDQLSAGDWENLTYEVMWFGISGPLLPGEDFFRAGDTLQNSLLDPNNPLLPQEEIKKLQRWSQARLEEFITSWAITIPIQSASALVVKRDRKSARTEMVLKTDNFSQSFAFAFAQILREAGARLNQCPECLKYYSARSNQTYCSPRCQNRVSLQKFRAKPQSASQPAKKKTPRKKKLKR
jgi:hypothetical protein